MKEIKIKYLALIIAGLGFITQGFSRENVGEKLVKKDEAQHKLMKFAAACEPATASADLDVNNVRTKILNGGDMWWDLSNPKYEIPKVAANVNSVRKHSLFSGAIWVGGYDTKSGGNLKLAAMTYRQNGSDFWPGPLDNQGNTNETTCKTWDNIYKVTQKEITEHYENWKNGTLTLSENILNWPGNKNVNDPPMAPYVDQDKNGRYSPIGGDYPILQDECRGVLRNTYDVNKPEDQPDEMLYFAYNDKGNTHSESGALPIGLELHTIAFAYATNDEINNMTFYTTRIVNKGAGTLYNTYFGEWVDADLGNYRDDYVGCDVGRSLGFAYNGDDNDEGVLGYGLNPPSIGIDFFEGPKKDTIVNGRDTTWELGMSKFVFYDNDATNFGNPSLPIHFYYYLTGKWKNGQCMTNDGKFARTGTNCTNYVFPFDSDPTVSGNWNEKTAGNPPADRRFLQTSGPFTLKPGAVNKLTVGVVWARASSGGADGSLNQLRLASDKAQSLFNNCFDVVDGPDAPETTVRELDQELVFMFNDTKRIENYSAQVKDEQNNVQLYKFEGYRVYQLKDGTVGTGDLEDIDKAREVFYADLKNNVIRLVNKPYSVDLGERVPKLMIDVSNNGNKGLVHSVSLKEDAFATGSNKSLVNFKTYYYLILSYAAEPNSKLDQYLAGRRIRTVVASPRNVITAKANAGYNFGPRIRRIEGSGNGGNIIDLTEETELAILRSPTNKVLDPVYEVGKGPLRINIVDPLKVPKGEFELVFLELEDSINKSTTIANIKKREAGVKAHVTRWIMVKKNSDGSSDTVFSENNINIRNEQMITKNNKWQLKSKRQDTAYYKETEKLADWGMSVTIEQVLDPGNSDLDETNGVLGCEVIFENNGSQWLTAMRDVDGVPFWNWIHSGTNGKSDGYKDPTEHDYQISVGSTPTAIDPFENYEKLWEGRVGPYRLASRFTNNTGARYTAASIQGVAFDGTPISAAWPMNNLSGVELVITKDKSKWSKVCVLEMSDDNVLSEGSTRKFSLRSHASLNLDGTYSTTETGRSWFPGYAINVETGERLNIIIGEDSRQYANNGRDMKWNPTSDAGFLGGVMNNGGRHYIYVMGSYIGSNPAAQPLLPIYDEGNEYHARLSAIPPTASETTRNLEINKVMFQCMYVIPTYLASGFSMKEVDGMPMPESEVRFKIRVKKPYRFFKTLDASAIFDNPRYTFNTNEVFTDHANEYKVKALELVNIVPNPYYAYSDYENTSIENKVKLTNLPLRCDISIYTVDGTLVRRMKKDDGTTDLVWDMKNDAKVPIASGVYLIHVNAPGIGEKVIKWMGVMRELDLDSF